jgi:hypothetical protein
VRASGTGLPQRPVLHAQLCGQRVRDGRLRRDLRRRRPLRGQVRRLRRLRRCDRRVPVPGELHREGVRNQRLRGRLPLDVRALRALRLRVGAMRLLPAPVRAPELGMRRRRLCRRLPILRAGRRLRGVEP